MRNKLFRIFAPFLAVVTLGHAISAGAKSSSSAVPIDEILSREVDVTGDGISELIVLNIRGENWQKPIVWALTIKSEQKVILEHQSDDTWLNNFFSDTGYVQGCTDYISCKKKYYEEDILEQIVVNTDLSPNTHAYDKSNTGSIHVIAREELLGKYYVSEERASEIIQSMIVRLRSGNTPVLYIPISAVQNNFPVMYVPEVNGFVRVYEW